MVFLDKCCIPQNDPIAKSYGISRLADYLRVSNKLLILWSPDYLERLWCVYELAVFLRTHKKEDVILVNMNHIKLCVSLMLVQFLTIIILDFAEEFALPRKISYIGYLLTLVTSFLIGREAFACSEEWREFCSKVKSFTVRRSKCSSLADYSSLKQLIADMYGSEARFEAVVRGLWLGESKEKRLPSWLFSWPSMRLVCAPYIPLIIYGLVRLVTTPVTSKTMFMKTIVKPGIVEEPLPSALRQALVDEGFV
ncbi:hypothetical protein FOZ60_004920 [Perkinsus olseni]|uniref:TIR domain-containing protein n=2 Tax=Perkinsus olseni TaxID=32597 RepID=A0A7J6NS55_PEROL|nr:hypothetical protein FOZ60_004920 [Perkinsus olseni]